MSKVYAIVTDRILAALAKGVVPWRQSWKDGVGIGAGSPVSLSTGKAYRGINALMLSPCVSGFSSPWWGTFKQIQERGGQVKKGSKASPCVFFKLNKVIEKGKEKTVPLLLYYSVFNADQTEGLELPKAKALREFVPIDRCEQVVHGYCSRSGVRVSEDGNGRAFYRGATDSVHMPVRGAFRSEEDWYAVLTHELVHSSGHPRRLARDMSGGFGSKSYAREELVAEIGSSFLCAELGIDTAPIQESEAAYVASWMKTLKEDERAVVVAAGAAQRAADLILGREEKREETGEEEEKAPAPAPVVVVAAPARMPEPKGLPALVEEGYKAKAKRRKAKPEPVTLWS